jgi:hypothetical protein
MKPDKKALAALNHSIFSEHLPGLLELWTLIVLAFINLKAVKRELGV